MLLNILLLAVCGIVGIAYTFSHKFARRPLGIHDLPLELLSEIASQLDFVDVISLRQSTRKLREATEARVVWHSLAKRYAARHFNIPRPENGTIDSLTTNDLREWIRPRLVIDQIWKKKTATPFTRTLHMHEDTMCVSLIPGGRWLLAVRETGYVDFYDLNSKDPVRQLLLEPSVPKEEAGPTRLVVDINREAPLLDFTFAFSSTGSMRQSRFYTLWSAYLRSTGQQGPFWGWLHVRRAQLAGAGPSAILTAHKLVSIPHIRRDTVVYTTGLSGGLVARNVARGWDSWIEVFKWKECTSTELVTTSIRVKEGFHCRMIYLIGEDRVLCVAAFYIFVYRIPPFSRLLVNWDPEVGYQSDEDVTQPIWSYTDKPFALRNIPSFYFDGATSYRLIVQDRRDLVGVYIPLSSDSQPCVCFRIQPPFSLPIGTGLYKGCATYEDAPAIRLGYGWDGNADAKFINAQGNKSSRFLEVLFDEETGRCLFGETNTFWVVDFVSYSYQSL